MRRGSCPDWSPWLVLVGLLLCTPGSVCQGCSEPQVTVLPATGVVALGEAAELRCKIPAACPSDATGDAASQGPVSLCSVRWELEGHPGVDAAQLPGHSWESTDHALLVSFLNTSVDNERVYACIVTCSGSVHESLRSLPLPLFLAYTADFPGEKVDQEADSIAVCSGNSAFIPCTPPEGHPQALLFFLYNNALINSSQDAYVLTGGGLIISPVNQSHGGQYRCGAHNEMSGQTRVSPSVTSLSIQTCSTPVAAHSPVMDSTFVQVPEGGQLLLTCPVYGWPTPVTHWNKFGYENTGRLVTTPQGMLQGQAMDSSDSGTYMCSTADMDFQLFFHVTVEVKPSFVAELRDQSVAIGRRVEFQCSSSGDEDVRAWYHNGRRLSYSNSGSPTITDKTLVIKRAKRRNAGYYQCIVTNSAGSSTTSAYLSILEQSAASPIGPHDRAKVSKPKVSKEGPATLMVRWRVPWGAAGEDPSRATASLTMQRNDTGPWEVVEQKTVAGSEGKLQRLTLNLTAGNSYRFRTVVTFDGDVIMESKKTASFYLGGHAKEEGFPKPEVSVVSATSYSLSWEVARASWAADVQFFRVQFSLLGVRGTPPVWTTLEATLSSNTSTYLWEGLLPGRSYKVRLSASLKNGLSKESRSAKVTVKATVDGPPPHAPHIMFVIRESDYSLHMRWSSGQTTDAAVLFYIIQYRPQGVADWSKKQVTDEDNTNYDIVLTDLRPSTVYLVRMSAWNAYGEGPLSATVSGDTTRPTTLSPADIAKMSPLFGVVSKNWTSAPAILSPGSGDGYYTPRRRVKGSAAEQEHTLYVTLGCVLAALVGVGVGIGALYAWRQKCFKRAGRKLSIAQGTTSPNGAVASRCATNRNSTKALNPTKLQTSSTTVPISRPPPYGCRTEGPITIVYPCDHAGQSGHSTDTEPATDSSDSNACSEEPLLSHSHSHPYTTELSARRSAYCDSDVESDAGNPLSVCVGCTDYETAI